MNVSVWMLISNSYVLLLIHSNLNVSCYCIILWLCYCQRIILLIYSIQLNDSISNLRFDHQLKLQLLSSCLQLWLNKQRQTKNRSTESKDSCRVGGGETRRESWSRCSLSRCEWKVRDSTPVVLNDQLGTEDCDCGLRTEDWGLRVWLRKLAWPIRRRDLGSTGAEERVAPSAKLFRQILFGIYYN